MLSGATRALAICPGVKGIKYELNSKEWMGASAFDLRSSPGECVKDVQVTDTVASHSLQSDAVVMAEPVAT